MLAGASYAAAHDHDGHHDDHEGGFEAECVVCAAATLGGAKASPDEPPAFKPAGFLLETLPLDNFLAAAGFYASPRSARGPPFSFSSF